MSENLPHRTASPNPMQTSDWEGDLPSQIRAAVPEATFKTYLAQHVIEVPETQVFACISHLKGEAFDMLTDLTAVDRPGTPERFEIVYILYSFSRNEYVRVKTHAAHSVPSAVPLFEAANWLEREVFDMFGVTFEGHPNLKRILLPEDWQGHPLVKEASIIGMDNEWVHKHLGIESGQS